jgi:hypothetical protein
MGERVIAAQSFILNWLLIYRNYPTDTVIEQFGNCLLQASSSLFASSNLTFVDHCICSLFLPSKVRLSKTFWSSKQHLILVKCVYTKSRKFYVSLIFCYESIEEKNLAWEVRTLSIQPFYQKLVKRLSI